MKIWLKLVRQILRSKAEKKERINKTKIEGSARRAILTSFTFLAMDLGINRHSGGVIPPPKSKVRAVEIYGVRRW